MANPIKQIKNLNISRAEAIYQIKWMMKQTKPFKVQISIMLFISIFSLTLSFVGTIVGKHIVDATTAGQLNIKYIIFMVGATVFSIVFSSVTKIFSDYVNEKFSFGLKCKMFDRVQRCVWNELSQFHSGDIVTRLTGDVSTVSGGLISVVPSIIVTAIQLIASFGILFYFDRPLALFALIIGPVGTFGMIFFKKKYSYYQTKLRETESEYHAFMQENLANIGVVKTFQCEDSNSEYMQSIRKSRMDVIMRSSRLSAIMSAFMRLVFSTGYVVAFCWSAYRISAGIITYGTMTIFLTLVSQVQGSITSLGQIFPQLYGMIISAKRINEVIDIESERYSGKTDIPSEISVEISNLTFAYRKKNVLENLNINIESNDVVGIIGSSGIGKTTLVRLLLSLVKPQKGSIKYIDENGKSELAEPSSRRFISYVPQGNTMFSGTIESNLRIAKPEATQDEMWAALRIADAESFVKDLPDGLQTVLGEKAGGLSEGQAQRISIARAVLRDRPVLILDEATSALDEPTEAKILSEISASCKKTCFVITHRSSMLKYCSKIIEIKSNNNFEFS